MAVIAGGVKVNWSSVLFQRLKVKIYSEKQLQSLTILFSCLFEDVKIPLGKPLTFYKFKTLNARNIIALRLKERVFYIYTYIPLKVKKVIGKEKKASKKAAKGSKDQTLKPKRKLVIYSNDLEVVRPLIVKKPRTSKTKGLKSTAA